VVFLLPGFLIFLVLIVFPFLANIAASFTRWTGVGTPVWMGLANYRKAAGDAIFWTSFKNNLYLIITMIAIPTTLGLFLAAFLYDYIALKFGQGVVSFFRAGSISPRLFL